jgi:hypothetical protein
MNDITIANLALSRLGARKIDSFGDSTPEGIQANMHYKETRQELLSACAWSFATRTRQLARLADDAYELAEYRHVYALPEDFLRALELNGALPGYFIRSGRLETDAESVQLRSVADVDNSAAFPAYFREAFIAQLAARMAVALTGVAQSAQVFAADAERKTVAAMAKDANMKGRKMGDLARIRV